jgi:predicted MPP superfamily phosphohydrolase
MGLFLASYFLIYGLLHLYLFLKARAACHLGFGTGLVLGVFMVVMMATPVAVRLMDRQGAIGSARGVAYLGYTWMGLVFLLFCLSLCLELYNLTMRLVAVLTGSPTARLLFTGQKAFLALVALGLALGLWATAEARWIRLERLQITTAKLPSPLHQLKVAQISDLHLGLVVGERQLEQVLALIREAQPDLLVCTGDLVDAQMDHLTHLASLLDRVKPPLGKFAVLGNHECYAGIHQSERFLRLSGFTILRGTRNLPGGLLAVAGVDDPAVRYRKPSALSPDEQEIEALAASGSNPFTLLLKHRPTAKAESLGRFDLQLSGHTHKGQIFPFTLITRLWFPRQDGLYRLEGGSLLYVSRGTGTWGPPMRFLAPPEVTLITVTRTGG